MISRSSWSTASVTGSSSSARIWCWTGCAPSSRCDLAAIAEQRNGGMHGRLDNLAHAVPVFDGECGQFTQAAYQNHGQWPGQRRQANLLEPRAAAEPDEQIRQQLHAPTLEWPCRGGVQRRQLADPAQCDGRFGPDVGHVGLHGLTNLSLPVRVRIDGGANLLRQLLYVGMQQLEETLLLAGELPVERALRCAGVTDDVGDGGGPVSALGDRGREAVEQPAAERVDIDRFGRSRVVSDGCRHVRLLPTNPARVSPCQRLVPQGTVPEYALGTGQYQIDVGSAQR